MMRIQFDPSISREGGKGGLRILYPAAGGCVEYVFVRSVVPEKNCDIWRMSLVSALDEKGELLHPLTKEHAEWEMAIRLKNRPDFIGGYNHGDEREEKAEFILDGEKVLPESILRWREFSRLEILVESTGFDPASPQDAVLHHVKKYVYDESGVRLEQEVKWLRDMTLDGKFKSYLAMMPPLKHLPGQESRGVTHSFAFGEDQRERITTLPVEKREVHRFSVEGDVYRFTMSADGYAPLYPNSYLALLTDNGKMNYHKMYISFAGGGEDVITKDTVWHSLTRYQIEKI